MRFNIIRKRYAMAIDTRRCVGCSACVLTCKAENASPSDGFRSWIETETAGTFPNLAMSIYSERCEQCSNAPCVANCPTGASHFAKGGVVLVDHDMCTGCKACVAACPYGARYIHPDGYADKCTFCLHRVEEGKPPACVENCPTRALTSGDTNDPESAIARLLREHQWKQLNTEAGTKPNLYYLL